MRRIGFPLGIVALVCGAVAINATARHATAQAGAALPQLVILDTDIGDDIDDAFALGLVLQSPELRLLGVTTAFRDTELRARLVDRYLDAVGRKEIPVSAGVATPVDAQMSQAAYAQREPLTVHPDGVESLLSQIRKHPDQITLIAIGPLFNVQAAIERNPSTFRKLKRVVIMGGSIERGYDGEGGVRRSPDAEWNIKCDPAGLKELLSSGVPVYMMPLDSTQIHLEIADREKIFSHGSPLTDQITLLYHQWAAASSGHMSTPTLFDPVAVAFSFRPGLCPVKPMHLDVDAQGFTRPGAGEPNAQVCLQSDEKGFLELLLDRLTTDSGR